MARFDDFELRILAALQKDGRLSNQELAEQVGLSASPCWRRTQGLIKSGAISGFVALLDREMVGLPLVVFASMRLRFHDNEVARAFEDAVAQIPEVQECYGVMGEADFLLKIAVASVSHYDRLVNSVLMQLPGVEHIHSNLAMRTVKHSTALPLDRAETA